MHAQEPSQDPAQRKKKREAIRCREVKVWASASSLLPVVILKGDCEEEGKKHRRWRYCCYSSRSAQKQGKYVQ